MSRDKKTIRKLLIANRGEIACRILRTTKKLNITSVVIYSDVDANTLPVRLADEAYYLGPAPAQSSYLNQQAIIKIALESKVDAIHPGYGFLSENAEFAKLCEQNNIIFIGPKSETIQLMGDKHRAKQLMSEAHIPVILGYHGEQQSISELYQQGLEVGFPLMIKASRGGGGKGMRLVYEKNQLKSALESAKREALSSFGNDELILEQYVEGARHIEVQILCDQQGNCWYLQDRECSIQRRHQKIIEEAPAPNILSATREQMAETAISAATAINYQGAGTIEFLLDNKGKYYFMEMNTRLQVEHPVTEMICQLDMVAWQIYVAEGKELPPPENFNHFSSKGHAIEARIYAEDPGNNFMPDIGTINYLHFPVRSTTNEIETDLRIDTSIEIGSEISVYYDPLLAKLIVWGKNRDQAVKYLQQSLNETQIIGVKTNLNLLYNITAEKNFANGEINTEFLGKYPQLIQASSEPCPEIILAAAISAWYQQQIKNKKQFLSQQNSTSNLNEHNSPWLLTDGWRNNQLSQISISLWEKNTQYTLILQALEQTIEHTTDNVSSPHLLCYWQDEILQVWIDFSIISSLDSNPISPEKSPYLSFPLLENSEKKKELTPALLLLQWQNIQPITENFHELISRKKGIFYPILFPNKIIIFHHGEPFIFTGEYPKQHLSSSLNKNSLNASMPGIVTQVCVSIGQKVESGDPLMILEAMKMEHVIHAPYSGEISEIFFKVGDRVSNHEVLLAINK